MGKIRTKWTGFIRRRTGLIRPATGFIRRRIKPVSRRIYPADKAIQFIPCNFSIPSNVCFCQLRVLYHQKTKKKKTTKKATRSTKKTFSQCTVKVCRMHQLSS